MDAINAIVDHVTGFEPSKVPRSVVETTKAFILDTVALMIAGRRAPGCGEVIEQLRRWGGAAEAVVVGDGIELPAPYAALANSLLAHAFDFDDTHERGDMHAYAVVVPAALAVAERGAKLSGREFIAAVALGVDIAYRMGMAIKRYRGWHPTATCGVFGAALAAGRIAKLQRNQVHDAMGIAYSLASGNFQCILDGSLTKRLQPAFAARAAVEAVTLAALGITGAKNTLEGKFGFYPLYEAGEYDRTPLVTGLGATFEGENASMKPYPSCRFCHAAVDAVLDIANTHDVHPRDVASITVRMPAEAFDYVGGPYVPRDSPQVSAQFNTAYNVAVAILRRRVGLREFDEESVLDPETVSLAARVETVATEEPYCFGPQDIAIRLNDGRVIERRVVTMKGHPDRPMSRDERVAKVQDCLTYGGSSRAAAVRLTEWAHGLDESTDVVSGLATSLRATRA